MGANSNIDVVKTCYDAFGRGDVAAILDVLTDDVDWASDAQDGGAPWYGVRHGKDAVADFFNEFGAAAEVREFSPLSFAANDEDEVHSLVRLQMASRETGREAQMDLHHYFRFRDGKIAYYRGSEDTAQTVAMLRG